MFGKKIVLKVTYENIDDLKARMDALTLKVRGYEKSAFNGEVMQISRGEMVDDTDRIFDTLKRMNDALGDVIDKTGGYLDLAAKEFRRIDRDLMKKIQDLNKVES